MLKIAKKTINLPLINLISTDFQGKNHTKTNQTKSDNKPKNSL